MHSVLLICACLVCFETKLFTNAKNDSRLVGGGYFAKEGSFPYIVSLKVNGTHNCGGSILTKRWILTSAHCLFNNISQLTVVAGTNLLDKGGTTYKVKKIIPHPEFKSEGKNDIGLIQLTNKIIYGKKIKKAKLTKKNVPDNTKLILSGWGMTTYPGEVSNKLRTVNIFSVSNKRCIEAHPNYQIFSTNICTGNKRGQGTCLGDFGGPLMLDGYQVGVVSRVIPCPAAKPDVFTRVKSYISWIKKVVK